jgi:hypothetical protein
LAPDSEAVPISFGVCISVHPAAHAYSRLSCSNDREQQLGRRPALHGKEPPAQPVLDIRVLVDRQRRLGPVRDPDRLWNNLQTSERDRRILY